MSKYKFEPLEFYSSSFGRFVICGRPKVEGKRTITITYPSDMFGKVGMELKNIARFSENKYPGLDLKIFMVMSGLVQNPPASPSDNFFFDSPYPKRKIEEDMSFVYCPGFGDIPPFKDVEY